MDSFSVLNPPQQQGSDVLVLHSGPLDAWRFEFDSSFQYLATAGIAIIAPNQCGSSGSGASSAHKTSSFDSSYEALMALLAARCDPGLWSQRVTLAPFLLCPQLCYEASPTVTRPLPPSGSYSNSWAAATMPTR